MRLVEFRAENFARLVAVEIRPDTGLVAITGANAQGKTSVLKAIWSIILGKAAAPPVAIRVGTEECTLFGDFGAFKVTRTIRKAEDGSERWDLKVVDATGKRITKTPQAVIDGWLGALTFDPLEFARLDPKKQFDLLRGLVKGYDFDAKAKERKELFDARTDANRAHHQAQAAADRILLPAGAEPKAVDVAAKAAELQAAERSNAAKAAESRARVQMRAKVDEMRDEAEGLRARAATLEKLANENEAKLDAMAPVEAAVDTEALRAEIDRAAETAKVIALFAQRCDYANAAAAAKADSDRLTAAIDAIDEAKAAAIAAAKLPVKGLMLGDDEVIYRGVPFSQASTMEKIMVGAALGMAMKPELRIMTIDEASELDSRALETLRKMAEKNDFDVWFTKVDETGETGFVIVDGEVVS